MKRRGSAALNRRDATGDVHPTRHSTKNTKPRGRSIGGAGLTVFASVRAIHARL